ncbi:MULTISPECIES: alpha/beta fold hydrolase [Desulfococcus]|jgi:pimeloyl-ACP methyl ester carboxylesterase|uniref:Alpha/beta hydrolase fold protein n=1 Tax=Desulfococcus multivorans DSM 2059 TaxID=1121405 RepID=S7TVR3_DESML|nr:alpha/beta fold hydrolase [Desulfococcus multivorans]AQV02461.1 alpha/beta hydrolase [Desulfococcus multivorans]EPR41142.1 alpha/beta hydrolase fold protein [Desulfococcus multivorans DSM 2059]SJZ59635.1 alpha/beta hydrolase fold [Desulfococcus multivorans DSM 2059]
MHRFVPWNSQPLEAWAEKYAEGRFIDLAGRRTHFIERGRGRPVVLIHGFNLDHHSWIKNLDALAAHFKVYAPDLWGHGYSTREPIAYGYDLFEEQIRLFLDALDIQSASLIGHSMGGGTSIVLGLRHPDRVDKLVLVDASGIPTRLPFQAKIFRLKGVAEFLLSLPTDRIRRMNLADIWIHDRGALTEDIYRNLMGFQKIEGTTQALLAILRADFFNTLEAEIKALGGSGIPTMIIWGREDAALPVGNAKTMKDFIPGSRLEILEKAGHLANFDQADTFNELVIDFLNSAA